MANLKLVNQDGDRMVAVLDDGTKLIAYPTSSGTWLFKNGTTPDPDPDPDPDPGTGGWHHPLGKQSPWTTYDDGGGSHSAGAVDFPLGAGTEAQLYAACDGTVIRAGLEDDIAGNVVIIQADDGCGIVTAHMNRVDVKVGDKLKGGAKIGLSGWTGYIIPPGPAGAHLHLEVRVNGTQWGPFHPAVSYFASKGVTL